jgi:hypothetical protein
MALFGVIRTLPASERRVLLSAVDGRLNGVAGERARLALEVLRRCEQEIGQSASKRRYEQWRERHPERGSSTYVANSFGGSWAQAMDAAGIRPAVKHATYRWHAQGPPPSNQDVLAELRRCGHELGTDFRFRDYRLWALRERKLHPERRGLLISPSTFIDRFGSFSQARQEAGLPDSPHHRGPRGRHVNYTPEVCVAVLQAAARELHGRLLTSQSYGQWRREQLDDARRRGIWRPIPDWKSIRDRFGSWVNALAAAGILSEEEAAQYYRGQGLRVPDEHVARGLCEAAAELGPQMTGHAYKTWRHKRIADPAAGWPPSMRVIQLRFGRWSTAVQVADLALMSPRPFDYAVKAIKQRANQR